jgi:hypothetical protein
MNEKAVSRKGERIRGRGRWKEEKRERKQRSKKDDQKRTRE